MGTPSRADAAAEKAHSRTLLSTCGAMYPAITASLLLLARAPGLCFGEGEHIADPRLEHGAGLVAPAAPRTTGYADDTYYDYSNGVYQESQYPTQSASDRQAVETLIAAPLIVTAFSAALFGGLLSPAITYGFERMSEYEIRWPEFTRKKKSGKSRSLTDDFDCISTLETVGQMVDQFSKVHPVKRSTSGKYDKFLRGS